VGDRLAGDMSMDVNCVYCGCELRLLNAQTYRKVTGWKHPGRGSGTNHLALEKQSDEFACGECIRKLARGIAPGQVALL
jgi:hypothetical protein